MVHEKDTSCKRPIFYNAILGNNEAFGIATMEGQEIVFYDDDGSIQRFDLPTAAMLLTFAGRVDLAATQQMVDTLRFQVEKASLLAGSRGN